MFLSNYAAKNTELALIYDWSGLLYTSDEVNAALSQFRQLRRTSAPIVPIVAFIEQSTAVDGFSITPVTDFDTVGFFSVQLSGLLPSNTCIGALIALPQVVARDDVWIFAGDRESWKILNEYTAVTPDVFSTGMRDGVGQAWGTIGIGSYYMAIVCKVDTAYYLYLPSIKTATVLANVSVQTIQRHYYSGISISPLPNNINAVGPEACILAETTPPSAELPPTIKFIDSGTNAAITTINAFRASFVDCLGIKVYPQVVYVRRYYPNHYTYMGYNTELLRTVESSSITANNKYYTYEPVNNYVDQQLHDNAVIISDSGKQDLFVEVPILASSVPVASDQMLAYQLAIDIQDDDDKITYHQLLSAPILLRNVTPTTMVAYRPPFTNIYTGNTRESFVDKTSTNYGGLRGRYDYDANQVYITISTNTGTFAKAALQRNAYAPYISSCAQAMLLPLTSPALSSIVVSAGGTLDEGLHRYIVTMVTDAGKLSAVFLPAVEVTDASNKTITLSWGAVTNEAYYDVYRYNGDTLYKINTTPILPASRTFVDNGVADIAQANAYYYVAAYKGSELIGCSTLVRPEPNTSFPYIIKWQPVSGATKYRVYGREKHNPTRYVEDTYDGTGGKFVIDTNGILSYKDYGINSTSQTVGAITQYGLNTAGVLTYYPTLYTCPSQVESVADHSDYPLTLEAGKAYTLRIRGSGTLVSVGKDFIPFVGLSDTTAMTASGQLTKVIKSWLNSEVITAGALINQNEFDIAEIGSAVQSVPYPKPPFYYIGGIIGLQTTDGGGLIVGGVTTADLPELINYRFRVVDGSFARLQVTSGMTGENTGADPYISWHWYGDEDIPDIEYFVVRVQRGDGTTFVDYELQDFGSRLITREMGFKLYTADADAVTTNYCITVEAVPTDPDLMSIMGEVTILSNPTQVIDFALAGATITQDIPRPRYQPIRILGYESIEAVQADAPLLYKNPMFEAVDKTGWKTMLPPTLSTYANTVEFYYRDGKLYTNTDIRALAAHVVVIYERLYDSVAVRFTMTADQEIANNVGGPKIYKYYIACLPELSITASSPQTQIYPSRTRVGGTIYSREAYRD